MNKLQALWLSSSTAKTPPIRETGGGIARLKEDTTETSKSARDLWNELTMEGSGKTRGGMTGVKGERVRQRRDLAIHKKNVGEVKEERKGAEDRKINEKYKGKAKSGGLQ